MAELGVALERHAAAGTEPVRLLQPAPARGAECDAGLLPGTMDGTGDGNGEWVTGNGRRWGVVGGGRGPCEVGRRWGGGGWHGGRGSGGRRPTPQREEQQDGGGQADGSRKEVSCQIEAPFGQHHHDGGAVLFHKVRDDLRPGEASRYQRQHPLVHGRTERAREVGRPARVHVQAAAAGALQLFLELLDGEVVVARGDGVDPPPGPRRIKHASCGAGAGKRVLRHLGQRQNRQRPEQRRQKFTASDRHLAATSFTAYPASRFTPGPAPPGHITSKPPNATTMPPYHTHHTSGLIVKRNTPCSVPFPMPAGTPYRASRRPLMIPTAVDGWNVGRPNASTCWRFSVRRMPMRFPSRRTSIVAAVTWRFSASYCEMPRWVNVYV